MNDNNTSETTAMWQRINVLQHIYRCTNCGLVKTMTFGSACMTLPPYCPTCGKKMKNPQVAVHGVGGMCSF